MLVMIITTVITIKILLTMSIIIIEYITDLEESISAKKKLVKEGNTNCLIKIYITKKNNNISNIIIIIIITTVITIKILLTMSIIIIEYITDLAESLSAKKKLVKEGNTNCLIKINMTKKNINKTTGYFIVCLIFLTFSIL